MVVVTVLEVGLAVGWYVVSFGVATVVVTSSASAKVSPRETAGISRQVFDMKVFLIFLKCKKRKVKGFMKIAKSIISGRFFTLTFLGADIVKVSTAACVVHTHGVTLTFPLRVEGATATHTGLCGNAGSVD